MLRKSTGPPSLWRPIQPEFGLALAPSFCCTPLTKQRIVPRLQRTSQTFHCPAGFSLTGAFFSMTTNSLVAFCRSDAVHRQARAIHQDEIAGVAGLQLAFDAGGPELVRPRHVQQHAAIGGLIGPSPLDVQPVVLVLVLGAHVAVGFARAADDVASDAPHVVDVHRRIGDVAIPAGEIRAIPQNHLLLGRWALGRTVTARQQTRNTIAATAILIPLTARDMIPSSSKV